MVHESTQNPPVPISNFLLLQFSYSLPITFPMLVSPPYFRFFIQTFGIVFHCELLVHAIPLGLDTVHNMLGTTDNTFEKYVVCPKCHSVYHYDVCFYRIGNGSSTSKLCHHIAYPNHPQQSRKTTCNTLLLRS